MHETTWGYIHNMSFRHMVSSVSEPNDVYFWLI